ncbi:GRAM domain-containing protein [Cyclobacterium xiamenense]|uniref:GRAM domain-containing protein n=1 Tax=Cyclobacterium xiamenense TaxID=1297121 RepID=A0A1H6TKS4_9BACT|nr:GRAM domain-containing protein [Cyclobacterium xiamenense]SEI79916.1 GRAM domain-containing protein [Cyclobacterium xiamenense]
MRTDWKYRLMLAFQMGVLYTLGIWAMDYFSGETRYSPEGLLVRGLFFGLSFGLVFPFIFNRLGGAVYSKIGAGIHPVLEQGEEIQREAPATLFKGMEGVGGKLFLTNKKLIFKSHALNIQKGQTDIDYKTISGVEKREARKRGYPGIRVHTKAGREYQIVVEEAEDLIADLSKRIVG